MAGEKRKRFHNYQRSFLTLGSKEYKACGTYLNFFHWTITDHQQKSEAVPEQLQWKHIPPDQASATQRNEKRFQLCLTLIQSQLRQREAQLQYVFFFPLYKI